MKSNLEIKTKITLIMNSKEAKYLIGIMQDAFPKEEENIEEKILRAEIFDHLYKCVYSPESP